MTDFAAIVGEHRAAHPYFLDGVKAERERIITLLEARHDDLSSCAKDDTCRELKFGIDLAISDILGENR